ncbi:MAG: LacI family DNA-binding transcriptional regulator [Anaerolineales bacterium]|nr:LacI family DNA-binding transcriptional regulator [Anaerolineales bacterium]
MSVTIRDVAKQLNLSIGAVSRALDGYPDISEATRQRVTETARAMGYVPNRTARQLRKQTTETIGYILPAQSPRFADPFYSEFIAGLGDEAATQNYDLLISTASPGEESEQQLYQRWVSGRRVDGYILNRMRLLDWRVQYLAKMKVPFVAQERSRDDLDYPSVEVDGRAGMQMLVRHLVKKGHRRIAYIGASSELSIQADRFAGYCQGLAEANIPLDETLVFAGDLTRHGGQTAVKQLLLVVDPPSAVVCINDLTAFGAMHEAALMGWIVGRELAVAGFDGLEESANTQPPLTTVNQPLYEIARQMVKTLLAEIHGEPGPERRVLIQPELLVRMSTQ